MKTFTVVTADAPKLVFETEANTFGELKNELANHGITLTGKKIIEGLTKIDMTKVDDEFVLPHDVTFKGVVTDNLVFMINSDKKIDSGLSRKEIIEKLKEHKLEEKVKDVFGRNYTNVSNNDLMSIISDYERKINTVKGIKTPIYDAEKHCIVDDKPSLCEALIDALVDVVVEYDAVEVLLESLVDHDILESFDKEDCEYTDEEIDEMFKGL